MDDREPHATSGLAVPDSGVMLLSVRVSDGRMIGRLRWSLPGESEQSEGSVAGAEQITAAISAWLSDVERAAAHAPRVPDARPGCAPEG